MEVREIKHMAAGRWGSLIASLAPQLGRAIKSRPHHVPCPVHDGVDGFRLFKDFNDTGGGVCNTCGIKHDGYTLLMWVNGWDFKTTHSALQGLLLTGEIKPHPRIISKPIVAKEKELDVEAIRDALNHVWKSSLSLLSPEARPARLYFANRGITGIDYQKINNKMIRFVPFLEYYEKGKLQGKYPAIVTMVCDKNGRPSTIHRTYITLEGVKAPVPSNKKMMRHCANNLFGGMRIAAQGNSKILAITEGIETALAVMSAFNVPVWVAGNAYLLENFAPPKDVVVVIYADKDQPSKQHPEGHGQHSARLLLKRLWSEGIQASIKLPDHEIPQVKKSVDWLDVISGEIQSPVKKTVVS